MLTSLVFLQIENVKKSEKLMKTVNIDGENLQIFWKTSGISIQFLGKVWLMITLEVTKNQSFALCLEDTFLEKPQGQIDLLQPFKGKHSFLFLINDFLKIWKHGSMSFMEAHLSGSMSFLISHNQTFVTWFYTFTNQLESKIT